MSKVLLSYTWNRETFLEASQIAYNYEMKHSPKRFLGWVFIAMTQFGVVAAMKKGAVGLLVISTFLVIYWYAFRWKVRQLLLLRQFEKSPMKDQPFHIAADESGLHLEAMTISWDQVKHIVSVEKGFLIYADETFLFFPTHAFANEDDKNSFAVMAKKQVASYTKA